MKKSLFLFLVLFFVGASSCKKDQYKDIPNVYVNLYLNINSTLYMELNNVGGWVNITGGYQGILVYRESTDLFMAYERTCPYDPDVSGAMIVVDTSGLTMSDGICGSRYLILDGSVVNGPATLPLKQYRTEFDGNTLHIYN
ncbi:MAG: hypothetical protein WCM76_02730 [Bacteroidota bacterium]